MVSSRKRPIDDRSATKSRSKSDYTNMEHESPKRIHITGLCGIKHMVLRFVYLLDQCGICELHATTDAGIQV